MPKTTAIAKVEPQANSAKITVEDVKQYICPSANDKEIMMFMKLCESHGLNPWIKEAHLIKYGAKPAQIITGKDTFTKRAQNHKDFRGFEAGVIVQRIGEIVEEEGAFLLPTDKLVGGWARVHVAEYAVPITAKVSMKEYSKEQATWKNIPATMIRKVALVQALREAFPDQLCGLYDSSEVGVTDTTIDANYVEVKDEPKPAAKPAAKKKPPKKKEKPAKDRCEAAMNKYGLSVQQKDLLHKAYSTDYEMLLSYFKLVHKKEMNLDDLISEATNLVGGMAEDAPPAQKEWDGKSEPPPFE